MTKRAKATPAEFAKKCPTAIDAIASIIRGKGPMWSKEECRQLASEILARLAGNDPPLLVVFADKVKD